MERLKEKKEKLFSDYGERLKAFLEEDREDLISVGHPIFSHCFMDWIELLNEAFPGLAWRGVEEEKAGGFTLPFDEYKRILFERFFIEMTENVLKNPDFAFNFTEEELKKLKEAGWQAYLED